MKTTRNNIVISNDDLAVLAALMLKYNLQSESEAISKVIELASVTLPKIHFKCGGLETANKALSNQVAELSHFLHSFDGQLKKVKALMKKHPYQSLSMF